MKRTVKSYVLRAGRISNRQQTALDQWLGAFELDVFGQWDFADIFKRSNPTIVEIGFGMGASLVTMAESHPELNFVGIEVHRAGVGSLVADLYEHKITNVRVVFHDAVAIFNQLRDNSIDGVQIFFPDPWPKKRHHKRRLIQPAFVQLLVSKLKPGAFIHCATDWQEYADHMLAVLSAEPNLMNQKSDGGFIPRPATRPLTKFEKRGQGLGHGVWDLVFVKNR